MRVGIVGPVHPYTGGIAQHATRLALELEKRGHEVLVESWKAQYPRWLHRGEHRVDGEPEIGQPRQVTEKLAWYSPFSWWAAGKRLRGCDVVVFSTPTPTHALPYRAISQTLGDTAVRVGMIHNVSPHEKQPFDRALTRLLARVFDRAIVHGGAQERELEQITAGHLATSTLSLPSPWPQATPRLPRSKPEGEPIRLLFFGTVRPYKGLDLILHALTSVDTVELVVAGDFWGHSDHYTNLVTTLGLRSRVDLRPGYVPAAGFEDLFSLADAVVMPYRSGTGSIVRELAFRFGLPVLTTQVGSIAEGVVDGSNGLIIPDADSESIADTLRTLTTPGVLEKLQQGLGRHARDEQELWRRYCEEIEQAAHTSQAGAESA